MNSIEGCKKHSKDNPDFDEKTWFNKTPPDEQLIMKEGSNIGKFTFPTWFPSMGVFLYFIELALIYSIFELVMFVDAEGLPGLTPAQRHCLVKWERLSGIYSINTSAIEPRQIANSINGFEVMENSVGDPSIAACLAVAANFEYVQNYQFKMISSSIYPQDENGNPIFSPCGKYIVKLYINGQWRAVTVDDALPVANSSAKLFAHSSKDALWVPIIEKAFAKAKRSYTSISTQPCMDLFELTSWVPERVLLKTANKENLWKSLRDGTKERQCLIILTTGRIENENTIGLKSFERYAVFDVIEINEKKLLLLKNPCKKLTWQGPYSDKDETNWTEEIKTNISYYAYKLHENDVFWIDYDTMTTLFESVNLNWNPSMLVYRQNIWGTWKASSMVDDEYNLTRNPQISCEFFISPADVLPNVLFWVIVSKIPGKDETFPSGDFFGLSAYLSDIFGQTVYNANSQNDLSLVNEQHALFKFTFPKASLENQRFINFVLRQYLRDADLKYT